MEMGMETAVCGDRGGDGDHSSGDVQLSRSHNENCQVLILMLKYTTRKMCRNHTLGLLYWAKIYSTCTFL